MAAVRPIRPQLLEYETESALLVAILVLLKLKLDVADLLSFSVLQAVMASEDQYHSSFYPKTTNV